MIRKKDGATGKPYACPLGERSYAIINARGACIGIWWCLKGGKK